MSRTDRRLLALSCFAAMAAPGLAADALTAEVKKQKDQTEAHLKKAGLSQIAHAETDDLLVYAAVADTKIKSLADSLQKAVQLSRTTLKIAPDEKLWPGKLTAIVLTDPAQFTNFLRLVEQRRPDKGVSHVISLRGDYPYIIESVDLGEKPTDAELTNDAAAVIGAAIITRKAGSGSTIPEWLRMGFGRTIAVKTDASPTRLANHRTRIRAAVLGTRAKPVVVRFADVLAGQQVKDADLVAASLVEFLVFGPEAERFPKLLALLRPSDERPMPGIDTALADLDWKIDSLELSWKQWVAKQK